MTETAMFQPLLPEEMAPSAATGDFTGKAKPVPIVPVPADAPPMQYRHREHGEPSRAWAYHDAGGDVVSLAAYLSGTGQAEAARALGDMLGVRGHE